MKGIALLVVDMQKAYFRGTSAESMSEAAETIDAAAEIFRAAGRPVIWIQDEDREDGTVPGSEGYELIDLLRPAEEEPRVRKEFGNSFHETPLAGLLRERGVRTVVVTGYCAEHCVLSTYKGAFDRGFHPFLLKDGVAGGDREKRKAVELICDTLPLRFFRSSAFC